MAAGLRQVKIRFEGETRGLNRAAVDGERQLGKFQRGLRGVNQVALRVGAGVGLAAAAWVKSTATALGRIEKISAQTDTVIRSMGVKWTNTKEVEAYAAELEKLTGIEAELIQEGQNLLLTFGKIQNKAGAGNLIFDRATTAINDMSVALGQDMKSSAIQVGKALNDPIKGLTALQRVGVSFTAAQKKQITALTESGDVLGAQRIILAELEAQFGGSAVAFGKTMPGQIAKMKNAFGEVSEKLLVSLMPAFKNLLAGGLQVTQWMMDNQGTVKALGLTLVGLAGFVFAANGAYKVWIAAARVMTAVQWALNFAMKNNPIGRVITIISALIAIIVVAWKKNETFRRVVTAVWNAHKAVIGAVVGWFVNTAWPWMRRVLDMFAAHMRWVKDVVVGAWNAIRGGIGSAVSWVAGRWAWLKGKVTSAVSGIKSTVSNIWGGITTGLRTAVNWAIAKLNGLIGGVNKFTGAVGIPAIPRIPMLEHGGTARRGRTYLVGEAGPELFTPDRTGRVTSNKALMGSGGGVTVENLNIQAWSERFSLRQVQSELAMHGGV